MRGCVSAWVRGCVGAWVQVHVRTCAYVWRGASRGALSGLSSVLTAEQLALDVELGHLNMWIGHSIGLQAPVSIQHAWALRGVHPRRACGGGCYGWLQGWLLWWLLWVEYIPRRVGGWLLWVVAMGGCYGWLLWAVAMGGCYG